MARLSSTARHPDTGDERDDNQASVAAPQKIPAARKKHLVVIEPPWPHPGGMPPHANAKRRPPSPAVPASARTLWRFPGPLALARMLDGAPPALHHPDARRVYVGELAALWAWPGVPEFGALSIFDADRLAPTPVETEGWFVVAPAALDPRAVLYVPDRRCAEAVLGAADAEQARARLPGEHCAAATAEARRAMSRYDAVSRRVVDALEALGDDLNAVPERWRADAATPLHMLPPPRRDALAAALTRVARRAASSAEVAP